MDTFFLGGCRASLAPGVFQVERPLFLRDGEVYRLAAHNGFSPEYHAARLLLLFAGGNGRYCGLAIVAEIGEGISDASHFLDARRPEPPANARPTTVSGVQQKSSALRPGSRR